MVDFQALEGVLVLSLDSSGRLLSWNPACETATGWAADEVRGRLLADLARMSLTPTEPLPELGGFAQPAPRRFDAPLPTRLGAVRWIAWATTPQAGTRGREQETLALGIDISELKHLEASALLREELFRIIFEEASDGIAIANYDGHYIAVNSKLCEMVAHTREQMLHMRVSELVAPEERPRLAALRQSLLIGGADIGEWKILRGDGRVGILEVSTRLLSDKRWIALMREVSQRRQLQEERERLFKEIDAERRWLQAVIDTIPLGVLLFKPDGQISFNHRAEELLGMKLSRAGGRSQYQSRVFFPDGRAVPPEQFVSSRVLRGGERILSEEFLIEREPGSRVPVLGSAAPIRDAEERIIGGVGVMQDLSERMRAEQTIRASERLLRGIFELLPVGVWIVDETGTIVRTNPAGLRIWAGARYVGVSQLGEYKGWWVDTGKPVEPEDWAITRALRKGQTILGELVRIQCFDGTTKTIINSAMPLYDDQGRLAGAVSVNEDISDLTLKEEKLRRAVRERDMMLGVVSHDLRSPLQGIELSAKQLSVRAEGKVGVEWLHVAVDRILRASGIMRRFIEDLLDLTTIEEGRLSIQRGPVEPSVLVHEATESFQAQAEDEKILLEAVVEPGLPSISADHDRILQVLANLIGNALKFTREGGRVSVRAAREGAEVAFSVSDTGRGISQEQLPHLFERFWQADSTDQRGRGLGLVIARGIVELHGSQLRVDSVVGEGTTFSFSLPGS
jgi:PAS domain S-box-containing protein